MAMSLVTHLACTRAAPAGLAAEANVCISIGGTVGKAEVLLRLANEVASGSPGFFDIKGPGAGNHSTNQFVARLQEAARLEFGEDYSEKPICGLNKLAVDYYFPDEGVIVEVALGLRNPNTEFEKDILKALVAKESGVCISRLFFISKPGGRAMCSQPGRSEFIKWLAGEHQIVVEVQDLQQGDA